MAETVARWIVLSAAIYFAAGVLFAAAFVARGVDRIDPAAHRAGWGFRFLIAPGVAALWPLLARRWHLAARRARSAPRAGVAGAAGEGER